MSTAAMLMDLPLATIDLDQLDAHVEALKRGAVPVGSTCFVKRAMALAGVPEPEPMSYPTALLSLLGRAVGQVELAELQIGSPAAHLGGPVFVKPVQTKLFTGFVWDRSRTDEDYSEHDLEQLKTLRHLAAAAPHTQLWVSERVTMVAEWRYYVLMGAMVGYARYDDGDEDLLPEPDIALIDEAIRLMGSASQHAPVAYALDFARLDDGRTVLVEVNDAWSLGYYGGSVPPKIYTQMLLARWTQLHHGRSGTQVDQASERPTRFGLLQSAV